MSVSPTVAIVTVTYNSADEIDGFLDSLEDLSSDSRFEVIAVDNASSDDTVARLERRDGVRVLANSDNLGFGRAMNLGIAASSAPYVLLCNPDLLLTPAAIDALVATLDDDPQCAGAGPLVRVPGGAIYPIALRNPGLYYGWNFFSGFMAKFERSRWVNWDRAVDPAVLPSTLPWLHGCCALYRRAALDAVGGGYDDRFFMYFEDADLGRELRRGGWTLRIVPDAAVTHLEERSSSGTGTRTRRYFMESWHRYRRKHDVWPLRMLSHAVVTAALTVQALVLLSHRLRGRAVDFGALRAYSATHFTALLGRLADSARDGDAGSSSVRPIGSELTPLADESDRSADQVPSTMAR